MDLKRPMPALLCVCRSLLFQPVDGVIPGGFIQLAGIPRKEHGVLLRVMSFASKTIQQVFLHFSYERASKQAGM